MSIPDRTQRKRESSRRLRSERKAKALAAYGGQCACCGETNPIFLCIDHVESNGAEHRRQMGEGARRIGSGSIMHRWLEANGYPAGFQVLCANCNMAKQSGGCPHTWMELGR